jgi:uncharacterized protein (TIRG00374 family)
MRRRWGLHAGVVLTLLVLAGAIAFLYFRQGTFRWGEFTGAFRSLNPAWLAGAVGFALSTYLGRALRWRILMKPVCEHPSLWRLTTATAIGFMAIVMLGRPGELVRPYLIAMREKVPFSSQLGAWLLERVYDLIFALLIFGYALARVEQSAASVGPTMQSVLRIGGYAAAICATVCLAFLVAVWLFSDRLTSRLSDAVEVLPERHRGRVRGLLGTFTQGLGSAKDAGFVIKILGYSGLEWFLIVACYYCIFQGSPVTARLSVTDVTIFVGFVSFGQVIQIPGLGGGLQVASIVVLTELFAVALEPATSVAMVLWITMFVVIVPVGLVLAFTEGLSWARLKAVAQEGRR